jgi:hypothetical protein
LTPCSAALRTASTLAQERDPYWGYAKNSSLASKKARRSSAPTRCNRSQQQARGGSHGLRYVCPHRTKSADHTSEVDFTIGDYLQQKLHYWRKHPNLHGWMQRLYEAKGGQDRDFNLSAVALNRADLDALEVAIKAGDLPGTGGFFFGASDGSERDDDLEFVRKGREALQSGLAVFYVAWW